MVVDEHISADKAHQTRTMISPLLPITEFRPAFPHPTSARFPMNFFEKVYAVIRTVPPGQVISYGQVAFLAGNPHMSRQVGWALHSCPPDVPWHRVVRKDGSLPSLQPETSLRQRALLEGEGIAFDEEGRICRRFFGEDRTF